jgi:hypothetical protein
VRQAFCLQDVEWALGAIRIYYIFGLGIKPRLPLLLSSLCGAGRGIYTLRPTKARHLVYTHAASSSSAWAGSVTRLVATQLNCCVRPFRNVTCSPREAVVRRRGFGTSGGGQWSSRHHPPHHM